MKPTIRRLAFLSIFFVLWISSAQAQVDVTQFTAQDLASGYANGEFTATEVTSQFLTRIAEFNNNYHAFTAINEDAISVAAELDAERAAGNVRGPLHGVPIVIKESMDVAGMPSTGGFFLFSSKTGGVDLIPSADATVVARLRDAGAIILGKTNIPPFSLDDTRANNSWVGATFNTYNRELAPGGSSSGTAAAVSGGFAVLGMAEETGGSIQNPATAQSLVGIVPTFGLVPNTGVMPIGGSTRDVLGPHAKSVYDAALVLDAIAGPSPEDSKTEGVGAMIPTGGYTSMLSTEALAGKRLGLFGPGWRDIPMSPEASQLYEQAQADLIQQGAVLIEDPFAGTSFDTLSPNGLDLRGFESVVHDFEQYLDRFFAGSHEQALARLTELTGVDLFSEAGPLGILRQFTPNPEFTERSIEDPDSELDLSVFLAAQSALREVFDDVMETNNLDALVFPQSVNSLPHVYGEDRIAQTTVSDINIMGLPAVTVPGGYFEDNSPFGVLFVGRRFSEADLLGYAYDYEQATQHRVAPTLFHRGDFDEDGRFTVSDVDALLAQLAAGEGNLLFDLNRDRQLNTTDLDVWLQDIAGTFRGDANLDGEFNSTDLTVALQAGEYEDDVAGNSTWSTGDWNGDAEFDSSDIIAAFFDGGYEQGPRMAAAVPEPSVSLFALIGVMSATLRRRHE